jgi:hypothetical protein
MAHQQVRGSTMNLDTAKKTSDWNMHVFPSILRSGHMSQQRNKSTERFVAFSSVYERAM